MLSSKLGCQASSRHALDGRIEASRCCLYAFALRLRALTQLERSCYALADRKQEAAAPRRVLRHEQARPYGRDQRFASLHLAVCAPWNECFLPVGQERHHEW